MQDICTSQLKKVPSADNHLLSVRRPHRNSPALALVHPQIKVRLDSVPELELFPSDLRPASIQRLHYLFRQRTFIQGIQVIFEVVRAAGAYDDGVAKLPLQLRVVCQPA